MKENKLIIYINKLIEEVFEYSLSSKNVSKWISSIKKEIPNELPVRLGTKLKNIGVNSKTWNEYEIIDFDPPKTFTLKQLNGDYFVRYTLEPVGDKTKFEYLEWSTSGLGGRLEMSALEKLKELIEKRN